MAFVRNLPTIGLPQPRDSIRRDNRLIADYCGKREEEKHQN